MYRVNVSTSFDFWLPVSFLVASFSPDHDPVSPYCLSNTEPSMIFLQQEAFVFQRGNHAVDLYARGAGGSSQHAVGYAAGNSQFDTGYAPDAFQQVVSLRNDEADGIPF